jgi:hypothetical protein
VDVNVYDVHMYRVYACVLYLFDVMLGCRCASKEMFWMTADGFGYCV